MPVSETRITTDLRIEQRAGQQGRRIAGYAALFNNETTIAGAFREKIEPGAFRNAIAEDDVLALVNHNPQRLLGRLKSGTLALEEDAKGLRFEIDPPDTTEGRDLMTMMERGDVSGASFGFMVRPGGDSWDYRSKPPTRSVSDVKLLDVSVVTQPAYPDASAALRSLAVHGAEALRESVSTRLAAIEAKLGNK